MKRIVPRLAAWPVLSSMLLLLWLCSACSIFNDEPETLRLEEIVKEEVEYPETVKAALSCGGKLYLVYGGYDNKVEVPLGERVRKEVSLSYHDDGWAIAYENENQVPVLVDPNGTEMARYAQLRGATSYNLIRSTNTLVCLLNNELVTAGDPISLPQLVARPANSNPVYTEVAVSGKGDVAYVQTSPDPINPGELDYHLNIIRSGETSPSLTYDFPDEEEISFLKWDYSSERLSFAYKNFWRTILGIWKVDEFSAPHTDDMFSALYVDIPTVFDQGATQYALYVDQGFPGGNMFFYRFNRSTEDKAIWAVIPKTNQEEIYYDTL